MIGRERWPVRCNTYAIWICENMGALQEGKLWGKEGMVGWDLLSCRDLPTNPHAVSNLEDHH